VATVALADQPDDDTDRIPTGIEEVDRVLGGGIVPGSVTLLAGEPGIGKSTLTLQAALGLAIDRDVLLVCGEEGPQQVRARAARLGPLRPRVRTTDDPSLPSVLGAVESSGCAVAVVDSIQTVYDPEIPSAPGSVSQVRECGARLARAARDRGVAVILVGHVTKEGTVAGPRVLEHLVDVVLQFEGERAGGVRVLRALKNRFGSTQEVGFFEMTSEGLLAIRDASAYLLADRCPGNAGSVLAACLDGRRPFILEVQALVTPTKLPVPRRVGVGVDAGRLPMLIAVLQRRLGVKLHEHDIFVSAVGGLEASEPAADLPIVLAILSAFRDVSLPDDLVAFGEVGLAGEVRQVPAPERRLAEARSVRLSGAAVPHNTSAEANGIDLVRVRRLHDILPLVDRSRIPHD
jgi:DNA repair protein RadA/Sms